MVMSLKFAGRFLRRPTRIGAIAPSSRRLASTIASWPRLDRADVVVEFGPGTGAFTPHILERLRPGATYFALELDRWMCEVFQQRFPGVAVHCDTVANVGKYLQARGFSAADCIISGLPWATFSDALRAELMQNTLAALNDGGHFATFAYLHARFLSAAKSFRRALAENFSHVSTSRIVWRNLPPAIVYQCVK
jgi:phosphatidylethanolamine/phosphatidyl-N-methylethanolamine N-methyltransferase